MPATTASRADRDPSRRRLGGVPVITLDHRELAERRTTGEVLLRVLTPTAAAHPARVLVVADDMPFLIESLLSALRGRGLQVDRVVHPRVLARRDTDGRLLDSEIVGDIDSVPPDAIPESWSELQLRAPLETHAAADLETVLHEVLSQVRDLAGAAPELTSRIETVADLLTRAGNPAADDAAGFLRWCAAGNLLLLGLDVLADGGLPDGDGEATDEVLSFARDPDVRHVPRTAHPLCVTVRMPEGAVYVLRGLFTLPGRNADVLNVPVLRDRVLSLLGAADLVVASWSGQRALELLQRYPRTELLCTDPVALQRVLTSVPEIVDDRRIRVVCHRSGSSPVTVLVFLPEDRATTTGRTTVRRTVEAALGGTATMLSSRTTEARVTILHLAVAAQPGRGLPQAVEDLLEAQLAEALRTWEEHLAAEAGVQARAARFPPEYQAVCSPRQAAADLVKLDALAAGSGIDVALRADDDTEAPLDARTVRLAFYCAGHRVELSRVMPLLQTLGLDVLDEHPYELSRSDGLASWVNDFVVRLPEQAPRDDTALADRLVDGILAAWEGCCEVDGLTPLTVTAGLTWREVELLRAMARYLHQLRVPYSSAYLVDTVRAQPRLAGALVRLFEARFDPERSPETRAAQTVRYEAEIEARIEALTGLDTDRIHRGLFGLVKAVVRTNYFQRDESGRPPEVLALKLDPAQVPGVPAPRPLLESFVYSPRVEGVHLRFGQVARGGLRWSDRVDDYRTEILGLARTQTVKNAVIVPAGAKGGFVVKRPPSDPDALRSEAEACYRLFVSALLGLVDDLGDDGSLLVSARVVRYDDPDTYLVVAADKGTATLSDVANEVSRARGYWLDDAFASGGSTGYDHKAMGITARGAWCSVRRHFRELGIRTDLDPVSVVGIGDMSGDVFGNGMLLARGLRLIAAFDHRNIFLDPDPDPVTAHAERARLYEAPRSSWADYDPSLISPGGGVWPRTAKSVPVSAQARDALGLPPTVTRLDPDGLIRAILQAPVDLLWNGGIGTYVKAGTESHADVGDRTNDGLRVDGSQVRARVVAEGGNLGLTQAGRVELARAGCRLNIDAVDNSAGVGCSDHEVTIKILADTAVRQGTLSAGHRDAMLAELTDDVAGLVLADNVVQNDVLGVERAAAAGMLDVHARLIAELEARYGLDRRVDGLPDAEELDDRRASGEGLTSPELASLLAHVKLALAEDIAACDLPDDPAVADRLAAYFPRRLVARFPAALDHHPLRRPIVTTVLANEVVNGGGITYPYRLAAETGAGGGDVTRAFVIASAVFDLDELAGEIAAATATLPVEVADELASTLRRLLDRASRWLLLRRPQPLDVGAEIARLRPAVTAVGPRIPSLLRGTEAAAFTDRAQQLTRRGVPAPLAARCAALLHGFVLLDVVEVADSLADGPDVQEVAEAYFAVADRLGLHDLLSDVAGLGRHSRAQILARAAVRDEVYAVLRALTVDVLAAGHGETGPGPRDLEPRTASESPTTLESLIARWERHRRPALNRALAVRASLRRDAPSDLATVTATLQQVRQLLA